MARPHHDVCRLRKEHDDLAEQLAKSRSVLSQGRSKAKNLAARLDVELDAKKQAYIWDAEHVTFKIETYFARPLVEGIRHADGSLLPW